MKVLKGVNRSVGTVLGFSSLILKNLENRYINTKHMDPLTSERKKNTFNSRNPRVNNRTIFIGTSISIGNIYFRIDT